MMNIAVLPFVTQGQLCCKKLPVLVKKSVKPSIKPQLNINKYFMKPYENLTLSLLYSRKHYSRTATPPTT